MRLVFRVFFLHKFKLRNIYHKCTVVMIIIKPNIPIEFPASVRRGIVCEFDSNLFPSKIDGNNFS